MMNTALDDKLTALIASAVKCNDDAIGTVVLGLMDSFPLMCRVITPDLNVAWQSSTLNRVLAANNSVGCCSSLGITHTEFDCASTKTIRTGSCQHRICWVGPLYVSIDTLPILNDNGDTIASLEWLKDVTTEKRLSRAYADQQDLLEMVNKSVIEANHHLESAQLELEEKNKSLQELNVQLKELDHMKDEFISTVSHELKAPLTSIQGSVDLILSKENGDLSASARQLLTICQRNTHRLTRLVLDLLDIARIESGMMSLDITSFDATDLVTDCLESHRLVAEQKKINLDAEIPSNEIVQADRDRMQQVLVNLVSNACKFTESGSVRVHLIRQEDAVSFVVEDTGPGIPESEFTRIFDKFTHVSGAMSRSKGGTGLGLSIVRGIAREHGGDVTVKSTLGQGTTFSVQVPQPPILRTKNALSSSH